MSSERKGILDRFIKEPVKEVSAWTWKLSAFASVIGVALGSYYTSLQLAMVAVAANILHNEAARSMKKSPA